MPGTTMRGEGEQDAECEWRCVAVRRASALGVGRRYIEMVDGAIDAGSAAVMESDSRDADGPGAPSATVLREF